MRDPRIGDQILQAIGSARAIVSIGESAGLYEPEHADVIAVDPAGRLGDRPEGVVEVRRAHAESLPFPQRSFDLALAVNSVHTFIDPEAGVAEMARVAKRVVVLTWDAAAAGQWWWMGEYFTGLDEVRFPSVDALWRRLKPCRVEAVLVPHDCRDSFLGAYWQRPHAYLDARVREGIAAFSDPRIGEVHEGVARLAGDLANGRWLARWGALLDMDECDLGYRLLISG